MSQLHAVDGGTTYGLPYDCLMPPVQEEGKAELSCKGALDALYWWKRTCACGGLQPGPWPLCPRGLFELCLREAEVAADCWRRRNGLPAVAEAAGGSAGDSGRGGSSSSNKAASSRRQREQSKVTRGDNNGEDTGRQAGLCPTGDVGSAAVVGGSSSSAAADRPRVTLDPSHCPELAMQAIACSRALMKSSCRAGVGAGEATASMPKGSGRRASSSGGTDSMASHRGNTGVGEGDRGAAGGSLDGQGDRGGGSGDGMQEAAAHEQAGLVASVGLSGGDRAGQGGRAGTGTGSGGRSSAEEAACGSGSSGSGSGNRCPAAWVCNGGPLARRWWRAAVAAVHCAMDELEVVGSQNAASCVGQVLDLSLAMPVSDTGGGATTLDRTLLSS